MSDQASPLAFRSFQSDRVRFRTRAEGRFRPKLEAMAFWVASGAAVGLSFFVRLVIKGDVGLGDLEWFFGLAAIVAVAAALCIRLSVPARAALELNGDVLTLRRRFTRERFHRDDVLDAWSAPADDGYRAHLELADGRILSLVLNPEAARSLVEAVRPAAVAEDSAFALAGVPRRLSVLSRLGPLSRIFAPELELDDEGITVSWLFGRARIPYAKVRSADYGPRGVIVELVDGERLLLEPSPIFDAGNEPGLLEKNRARNGMQLAAHYESVARNIASRAALSQSNSATAYRSAAISA